MHGWEVFPGQAKAGDKFKPGRLLDDGVKSPWHRVFLDPQGPKIAPVLRSGAVDPVSLPCCDKSCCFPHGCGHCWPCYAQPGSSGCSLLLISAAVQTPEGLRGCLEPFSPQSLCWECQEGAGIALNSVCSCPATPCPLGTAGPHPGLWLRRKAGELLPGKSRALWALCERWLRFVCRLWVRGEQQAPSQRLEALPVGGGCPGLPKRPQRRELRAGLLLPVNESSAGAAAHWHQILANKIPEMNSLA